MLFNKSIKKFILLSLLVALPAQTMTMPSWFSFSSIKENIGKLVSAVSFASIKATFKKNKTAAFVVVGCVAICLRVLYYKNKKLKAKQKKETERLVEKVRAEMIAKRKAEKEAKAKRIAEEKKALDQFKAERDAEIEEES